MVEKDTNNLKKEDTNISCSHFQKHGHDVKNCWKIHLNQKMKWAKHHIVKKIPQP